MSNGTGLKSPATSNERRMVAWIGKAVRVEGKVVSDEDLTSDGDVHGSIELGGHHITTPRFAMADGATVLGKIQAG